MFKHIALLAVAAAVIPSVSFAGTTCQDNNQVNSECDYLGSPGFCNESSTSPTGWVCSDTKQEVSSMAIAGGSGGSDRGYTHDGEVGGSTDYFEVVECVSERGELYVETNPLGDSDESCETLFEFAVNDAGMEFIETESSADSVRAAR